MPRKTDNVSINNRELDRRVKLTDADRVQIRILYESGDFSYKKLALMFGVSKRLISFIINPEKQKANLEARAKRGGWKQYYDKDNHAKSTKEHREYKKKLHEEGKLTLGAPPLKKIIDGT